jgi:hypothetical protein
MRVKKRWIVIPACILASATILTAAINHFDPEVELPQSVQVPLLRFGQRHLGGPPSNKEPYGARVLKPFGPDEPILVSVCDSREQQILSRPGGDDHLHAALGPAFHVLVNAPNDKEAARYLRELFDRIGYRGLVAQTVIFAHGAPAKPKIGLSDVGTDLFQFVSERRPVRGYGEVLFVSCDVARGDDGRQYIQHVADMFGLRVGAPERNVQWHFWVKWFGFLDDMPNYDLRKEHWLIAEPRREALSRWSETAAL